MTNEEMVALFERRFDQIDQQFGQIGQQFGQLDQRFDQVDHRLDQVDQRLAGGEDEVHKAHILIEGLDAKIDQVIDGMVNSDQKLDRFRKETAENFAELRERVTTLETTRR